MSRAGRIAGLAVPLILAVAGAAVANEPERPNILLLVAEEAHPGFGGEPLAAGVNLQAGDLAFQFDHPGRGRFAVGVLDHRQAAEPGKQLTTIEDHRFSSI